MSDKCKNPTCSNELVHVEGRRKKEYCSTACKNKVNNPISYAKRKAGKPEIKYIPIEEWNKLVSDNTLLLEEIAFYKNKLADKSEIKSTLKNTDTAGEERTNSSFDNVPLSSEEGLAKIREIRAERIPKERDTSIGKKVWQNDQEKRILELKKLYGIK